MNDMSESATITKSGEVDFPAWVKVLAWIIGLSFPLGVAAAFWTGNKLWDMNDTIIEMRTELRLSRTDSYGKTEAGAAHDLLQSQIDSVKEDVAELRRLHGER